jgi:hypothetical protein
MSAAYAFLLASLILERLADPLAVLPAIIAGLVSRRWLHVAIASLAIAVLVEIARYVSNFHPALIAIGWASAAAWASLAFTIKRKAQARRAKGLSPEGPAARE